MAGALLILCFIKPAYVMTKSLFSGKHRWLVVGLLLVATTINYLDRQVLGLLKPVLADRFEWSQVDFARMVMAFTLAYAIGLLIAGRVIDRLGTKIGFSVMVVVWSLAGMAHALARNVQTFMAARFALGLGEAGNFPASAKTVAEWFPKKERGIATGIFNSGPSIGVMVSVVLVPLILTSYGWQAVFWITGASGFIWLAIWWFWYDTPERHPRIDAAERDMILGDREDGGPVETKSRLPWLSLFRFPQTWALIAGKGLIDPIFWFFLFWLPSYFADVFHLDMTKPSVPLLIIYASATVGSIGGGVLSSALMSRGWSALSARKFSLLVFALLELLIILTQFAETVYVAVLLISIAVAVHQAWATNIFTMASDLFPKEVVGSVTGIAGMAGSVGGILFPLLIGYLLETWEQAGSITTGYHILFTGCGFAYMVALVLIHVLTRRADIQNQSGRR